jgi:hypothetical protein
MKCYFCQQDMQQTKLSDKEYFCLQCHDVFLMLHENKAHLTWIRYEYKNKKYQAIWYLLSNKFRLYEDDGEHVQIFEVVGNGFDNITPQNILSKMSTILTFS